MPCKTLKRRICRSCYWPADVHHNNTTSSRCPRVNYPFKHSSKKCLELPHLRRFEEHLIIIICFQNILKHLKNDTGNPFQVCFVHLSLIAGEVNSPALARSQPQHCSKLGFISHGHLAVISGDFQSTLLSHEVQVERVCVCVTYCSILSHIVGYCSITSGCHNHSQPIQPSVWLNLIWKPLAKNSSSTS